jgi:hypothetical protein
MKLRHYIEASHIDVSKHDENTVTLRTLDAWYRNGPRRKQATITVSWDRAREMIESLKKAARNQAARNDTKAANLGKQSAMLRNIEQ